MKKLLIFVVALLGLTMVDVGTAQAQIGRRRARVTYAPARAAQGYRTYSYEPGRTTARSYSRTQPRGFGDATIKALGRY